MAIPYWDDDPETWDLLSLGTQTLTGVWDVEDGNGKRVFDIKKGPGRDGAIVKDMGYEPGAMTFVGQIVGQEQWDILQEVIHPLRVTQKEGKGDQQPIVVAHPKTLMMNIKQVLISGIDFPTIENGIMTVRIHAVEYVKPKANGKKKSKQDTSLQNALTVPEDQKRIQKALDEFHAKDAAKTWPEFSNANPRYLPYTPPIGP